MAKWLELIIPAHGDPETVCRQLTDMGLEGFVIEDERDFQNFLENNTQYWDFVDESLEKSMAGRSQVKLWLADDSQGRAALEKVKAGGFSPSVRVVEDSDWENNWKEYYKPVDVGANLVIVPAWLDYEGERIPIRLDPGLLFGTGDHPTTKMCLEALESCGTRGKRVLDIGCGSGILGIAAAVLGAASVEKAPEIVRENAALNRVESRFSILVGDVVASEKIREKLGKGYDLVFANIVADVIAALSPFVPAFLAENGILICSGILEERERETASALRAAGLEIWEEYRSEEWVCFVCRK